jgi:hypothetical protein
MKKTCLYIIAFLVLTGSIFAQSNVSASRWKTHEMIIDGNDRDWDKPINLYNDATGLFFAISNDSSNLYLNFTVTDPVKMMNIINAGWSVNFLAKNKKGKTKGRLIFQATKGIGMKPRKETPTDSKMTGMPEGKLGKIISDNKFDEVENQIISDGRTIKNYERSFHSFTAEGFIFTHGDVPLLNKTGIVISAGESNPVGLLYEMAIPLNELFEEESVKLNEMVTLVISVNAMIRQEGEQNSKIQGGAPGGMPEGNKPGGGKPGGAHPQNGGMPGSDMKMGEPFGNMGSSAVKTSFKQKIRLVSNAIK